MNNVTEFKEDSNGRIHFLDRQVSEFSNAKTITPSGRPTFRSLLYKIRGESYRQKIEALRELLKNDREAYHRAKVDLPAYTMSATLTTRGGAIPLDEKLGERTGVLQIDVDNPNDVEATKRKLGSDPHMAFVYVSPSGKGLKGGLLIEDPERHEEAFAEAERYFLEVHGVAIDPKVKDVTRLCFIGWDPKVIVNEGATPLAIPKTAEVEATEITETEPAPDTGLPDDAFGEPFVAGPNGASGLSQVWFGAKYAREELVRYDHKLDRFYRYGGPVTGLWEPVSKGGMRVRVRDSALGFLRDQKQSHLAHKANTHFQNSIVSQLMGDVETDFTDSRRDDFLHLNNGMLDVSKDEFRLCEFSPDYLSRNQIPVNFDPDATCPRFEDELLGMALDEDDIAAIQLYFGQSLLGRNPTQTFLMITGTPEGGKTQLLNVITKVIGTKNCYELRMSHINQRFEAFNWADKTLLYGADVKGGFLQARGAETIKKLVGGDPLNAERKHGQDHIELKGEYNLILTSNSRLRVALDGDAGAWRRRLVIVHYDRPPPKKRIPEFGSMLVREEGSGILNFALKGLERLRLNLADGGRFPRTETQAGRVNRLLDESDSVRAFVQKGLGYVQGEKMNVDDLVNEYRRFCDARGWDGITEKQVKDQLKDLILEFYGEVQQRNPSPRHWKNIGVSRS